MTPEQQKEELSKAYLHAVAARHRFKLGNWTQDDGCLDVTVGAAGTLAGGSLSAPKLDLQLKCTSDQSVVHTDFIAWELERRHYDTLRARAASPHLLVVLVLPENELEWIDHSVDQLIMRRCAWWVKMTGMPEITTKTKTVNLPKSQVFSPDALRQMMEKLSKEESL